MFTARYVLKRDTDDLSLTVLKVLKTTLVRRVFFIYLSLEGVQRGANSLICVQLLASICQFCCTSLK